MGSSLAAFGGPFILGRLRDQASESAMLDLTKKIDPEILISEFGSSSNLMTLIENKALTIPQLMQLTPSGTIDPTPFIYDTSLYVVLLSIVRSYCSSNRIHTQTDTLRVWHMELVLRVK